MPSSSDTFRAGLIECRAALDIPVVGLGEASMLYACMLGRTFGLVTINPVFIPWHRDQLNGLGLEAQARSLVDAGAEVIIPAGGLPMQLFAREKDFTIDGTVVLNGIATVAVAAEAALKLRRLTGVAVSRRGTFAKAPPEAIEEFLAGS